MDFYLDGDPIGTATRAPFSVTLDTTTYVVGNHTLEVDACEAGAAATVGVGAATVTIQNPISNLRSIADAYVSPVGQGVKANSRVVVAGTEEMGGSEFYIEDENRASAIRVAGSQDVTDGDLVTVIGDISVESGERSVVAQNVDVTDHLLSGGLKPFWMSNKVIAGGCFGPRTPGVANGCGLRTLGMFVKTTGRVTYVGADDEPFFYIDDGSALQDGSGHTGLCVLCRSLAKPVIHSFVSVTGISSCRTVGDSVAPAIKLRRSSDLATLMPLKHTTATDHCNKKYASRALTNPLDCYKMQAVIID